MNRVTIERKRWRDLSKRGYCYTVIAHCDVSHAPFGRYADTDKRCGQEIRKSGAGTLPEARRLAERAATPSCASIVEVWK